MQVILRFLCHYAIGVDAVMSLSDANALQTRWERGELPQNPGKVLSGFNIVNGQSFKWTVKIENILAMCIVLPGGQNEQQPGPWGQTHQSGR